VALAGARTSYACLDDSTFYAILRGRSYPSGLPVELCDLFRVDAAGVAHVSGAPGRCPDPAELPPPPRGVDDAALEVALTGSHATASSAARVASSM
jgi:hypothetical protein